MHKYYSRPIIVNAKNYFFTNSFSVPSVLLICVSYDCLISRFYPSFSDIPLSFLYLRDCGKQNWLPFCTRQIVSSLRISDGSSLQKDVAFLLLFGYLHCSPRLFLTLDGKFLIRAIYNISLFFPSKDDQYSTRTTSKLCHYKIVRYLGSEN